VGGDILATSGAAGGKIRFQRRAQPFTQPSLIDDQLAGLIDDAQECERNPELAVAEHFASSVRRTKRTSRPPSAAWMMRPFSVTLSILREPSVPVLTRNWHNGRLDGRQSSAKALMSMEFPLTRGMRHSWKSLLKRGSQVSIVIRGHDEAAGLNRGGACLRRHQACDPVQWVYWRAILEKYEKVDLIEYMLRQPMRSKDLDWQSKADRLIGLAVS
jgi:hypothetical protein